MKIKYFLLFVFLISINSVKVFSQVSREWISSYHFSSEDAKALAIDKSGNVYVTGSSGGDYATVKYNSSGIQQWASRYNGTGNSTEYANAIAVDDSGNVYVTGGSIGVSLNFDYATVKYNSSGVQQWVARYNGSANSLDEAFSIALDSSGSVYVTGGSLGSGTLNDYTTIKYSPAGAQQWMRGFNGSGNNADFATKVITDKSANVYVTGYSRGSGSSDDDFATIKYNSSGTELWVRIYQGQGDGFDQAQSIATDESGNVYVTGRSFGDGTQYDYATIKYNSSGDSLWVQRYNGTENSSDYSRTITVDNSGNVYVTGQSYSSFTNYDFATVKYNSTGELQWDRRFNGPGNGVENANSMTLDDSGNVYVTGSSSFTGQNYNYATVKYSSEGIERWSQIYNGTASGSDEPFSIAADTSGNIYITGGSAGLGELKNFVTIKYSQKPRAALTSFIEGFYNSLTENMVSDTGKVYLRNTFSPYTFIDSSKAVLSSSGKGTFYFLNIVNGINYYIVLKHRNSIETWSSTGNSFLSDTLSYNFSTSDSQAFGGNMIMIDSSPLRYAIYGADVNGDGTVDATDLSLIDNEAANFTTGYVNEDVTGNDFVDASDAAIADNNAANFVSAVRP